MRHISNKKGKCAHFFKERALDAKQIINFFLPYFNLLPHYHQISDFMLTSDPLSIKPPTIREGRVIKTLARFVAVICNPSSTSCNSILSEVKTYSIKNTGKNLKTVHLPLQKLPLYLKISNDTDINAIFYSNISADLR